MAQLVFSGGMIPVTARPILDQMSRATAARWGFAASSSTSNLPLLEPRPLSHQDPHCPRPSAWPFDMAMLVAHSVFNAGFVRS